MKVFVTGATGFIGSAVVDELVANGHSVIGLARTAESAKKLANKGLAPLRGMLDDQRTLARAASEADGVIHLAFMHTPAKASFSRLVRIMLGGAPRGIVRRFMAATAATELDALSAMGNALKASGKPFVTTFATMGLASPGNKPNDSAQEEDLPTPQSPGYIRAKHEEKVEELASLGVRASIIRLPPSVHGMGDGGLVPAIIKLSRKSKKSVYIEDGRNRWPAVHVRDAAKLYRLALEEGVAGTRYHAVAEEGMEFRAIAEKIAGHLHVPISSERDTSAGKHFGWLAPFAACDNPCSSTFTRSALGWIPGGPSLLDDLEGNYYWAT